MDVYEFGHAVSASDLGTRTVPIPANQATATFRVPTDDDDIDELAADVYARVLPGTGYTVGAPDRRFVGVDDNDDPVLRLGAARYGVTEGVAVRVTLNFRDRALFSATTVGITCTDGTASLADDLVFGCASHVSIPRDARSHTFTIRSKADAVAEGKETFTVAIRSVPSGVRIGTPSSATVTIADADVARPVVRVTPVSSPVTEGEEARFTVRRDIASSAALTVALTGRTNGAFFDSRLNLSNVPPKVTIPAATAASASSSPPWTMAPTRPTAGWRYGCRTASRPTWATTNPIATGGYDGYANRYDRNTHYPYETAGRSAAQVTVLDDEDSGPLSAELRLFDIPASGLPEGATGRFNLILSRVLETWETATLPLTLGWHRDAGRGLHAALREYRGRLVAAILRAAPLR